MLLLKPVPGNFPWNTGVSTSHFCSGLITRKLLTLAQTVERCILLLLHHVAAFATQAESQFW